MQGSNNLERFARAQDQTYSRALDEVCAGQKRTHWMWYVFPQIAGLGHSEMARRYAISGRAEAKAYLADPIVGARLREIVLTLQGLPTADVDHVFGGIDAIKLRSSLTLFSRADGDPNGLFRQALNRWFGGEEDAATVARL